MYDYQTRYYDPALGRFLQIDPAADAYFRTCPYVYTLNNPVRFTDPDGSMVQGPPDVITKVTNTKSINTSNTYTTREASITVTLKVVNSNGADLSNTMFSSNKGTVDLTSTFGGRALQQGTTSGPTNDTKITSFTVEYQVVSSLDDVGANDHVMVIVNDIPSADYDGDGTVENPVGLANGRSSAVEKGTIKDGSFDEVATHELGHNLGLGHTEGGNGLMGKNVNGSTSVTREEKGTIVLKQVSLIQGDGTYKESSTYTKSSKEVTQQFLDRNKIK